MRVLVTGGAGFIGSHTVVALLEAGHEPVVVDNFSNSKPSVLDRLETITGTRPTLHEADLLDSEALERIFASEEFDAIIHFAGLKAVGESVAQPLRYYAHNITTTTNLLEVAGRHGVTNIVFSSSATVYGEEAPVPYVEDFEPLNSTNPYGQTKVIIERILSDVAASDERWRVALLRYFNPVGAHPSGLIGEDPIGIPNNLTPYITQVAVGRLEKLTVYGDDYPTPDGTGLRDYIHVLDLAAGHVAALEALPKRDAGARAWNLGTGNGTSVKEVIAAFESAVGQPIPHDIGPRRPGDLAESYANVARAKAELGWEATRTIDDMARDTWNWQRNNPEGLPG